MLLYTYFSHDKLSNLDAFKVFSYAQNSVMENSREIWQRFWTTTTMTAIMIENKIPFKIFYY